MSVLTHLLLTVLVMFLVFSYVSCGYIAFFRMDEKIRNTSLSMRVFLWLLSPLVVLDLLVEKIFGRSLLS